MTNEELLAELNKRLREGELSAAEIQLLLDGSDFETTAKPTPAPTAPGFDPFSITKLLYIIGGIFITLGILYLVSQLWPDLSSLNRILITLGLGMVFAAFGSRFLMSKPERDLGNVFHAIGGFLIPGGALVTLDELSTGTSELWPVTLTIAVVFSFYVLLVLYHKRVILNFFAFTNGTALAYLTLETVLPSADSDIYAYMTMILGMSYLLYAYVFAEGWNARLMPFLLFFGPLGFYIAAFSQVFDTIFMEMLFPFLAFGGLVLAVIVFKSRIVLSMSTLAVIGYIIYFTAEYFADSIGWPVALILLGFIVIGIGYLSISLNRKYLKAA